MAEDEYEVGPGQRCSYPALWFLVIALDPVNRSF